jgi:hypothetical protein
MPLVFWNWNKEKSVFIYIFHFCSCSSLFFARDLLALWSFCIRNRAMVFNTTFNNISVMLWQSVLLMEETGVPRENHQPVASHWETLSHNVVHLALIAIRTNNIGGDRHWLQQPCVHGHDIRQYVVLYDSMLYYMTLCFFFYYIVWSCSFYFFSVSRTLC